MKWIKTLLAVFVAVALTSTPSVAREKVVRDADGNKWLVDTETAATPGAGSGEGAIIGAVDDTLAAYAKHKFDIQAGLVTAGAAGDDTTATESALVAATLFYRPVNWYRIGPKIAWNSVDNSLVTFSIPMGIKLNQNPWSTYNFWLALDILPSFTVRTASDGPPRESSWTYSPSAGFKAEVPMGAWSVEGGLGVNYPFAIEGVTDEAINAAVNQVGFAADVAINIRLGR